MAEHSINSRLAALTDGIITIAMTLLVLDIKQVGTERMTAASTPITEA